MLYSCGRRALELAVWGLSSIVFVQSVITPYMSQSFFFDWNPPGQTYPVPVTVQCGNNHIVWGRGTATGPNPVGPYYLQVYTSIYQVPIIIPVGDVLIYDWAVPFPPGTLYQICMFDKYGNTGGCQATYTVIANTTNTPACANVTLPHTLSIDARVNNGPISQYGWVDQCTDISITPKNGTPPYTLTIAPSLHPPSNITIAQINTSFNWTVNLSWASPFFLSVVDSAGNMWANGLLHSGQGMSSSCLAGNATTNASHGLKPFIAIGSGIGGVVVGLSVGILLTALFIKKQHKKGDGSPHLATSPLVSPQFSSFGPPTTPGLTSNYTPVRSSPFGVLHNSTGSSNQSSFGQPISQLGRPSSYAAQPFTTGEHGRLTPESASFHRPLASSSAYAGGPAAQNQVYAVHNNTQARPVTLYHEDGAQIVDLPPSYAAGASTSRMEGAYDTLSDIRSFTDTGSEGGRTVSTDVATLLQERRRPSVLKKPANGKYLDGANR